MKFSAAFVAAALPYLIAAEEDSANISRPQFTPTTLKAPFLEQFTDDWLSRWQPSHAKKDTKGEEEEWAYVGEWAVEEPTIFKGITGDKGLVVKNEAAHHAISAKFPKAIDPKGKELVVQYEVKLHNTLQCGGAYMKLLRENAALHADEFSNASPYVIMFGPDKCGNTNKVHFIFNHKHPKTGEYEEKHFDDAVTAVTEAGLSTLYTLHVKPDQTFEILVNGKSEHKGSLMEDFKPSVEPPKEIDDVTDFKPDDWVDDPKMPDPEAIKPDDWDEDAPREIVDEDAEMPDDWFVDEPQMTPDPEAEKPADWDDEEDGDWAPPMVPNPKCAEGSGCGPWEKPMKRNPDYKGRWPIPYIDNPAYKGVWAPKKISNPEYYSDSTPANFEPIGAIGFEIWTMQKDILFDNIYIGHSRDEADALKAETFDVKFAIEEKEKAAAKPVSDDEPAILPAGAFMDDPVGYVRAKVELFIELFKADPGAAIWAVPEVSGSIAVILSILITALISATASPKVQDTAKKAKDKAVDAKGKAAEAVSSGVDKAQAEVSKRTTRSSDKSE